MANKIKLDCVLLHGWGVTNNIWHDVFEGLSWSDNIIAPSLYEVVASINNSDLKAVATALNKKISSDCVLVGWSLGGLIATLIAEQTEKIKGLVYIASTPCFLNKKNWLNAIDEKDFNVLERRFSDNETKTLKYFAGLIANGDSASKSTANTVRQCLADKKNSATLSSWLEQMRETDQRKDFSRLNTPTLILLGEKDALINRRIENELRTLRSNLHVNVLKNCGHAPFISDPQQTVSIINTFVNAEVYG
jgi:pimeloyl-[acyl-carrier protein] methyl ester esterase